MMKSLLSILPAIAVPALASLFLTASCQEKTDEATFSQTVDFEGQYWCDLVDNPQYGGDLLYGPSDENYCCNALYCWADEATGLMFEGFPQSWGSVSFTSGGEAVSNYVNADYSGADYTRQLEVPAAPASGTNFMVHYGSGEPYPMLRLKSGEPFVIKSIDVIMTAYLASAAIYGGPYFGPLTKSGSFVGVRLIGFDNEGNRCASVEKLLVSAEDVPLYKNGEKRFAWSRWNTEALGQVSSFAFELYGSSDCYGDYGFSAPAYFAYDNVVIVREIAE